MNERIFYSEYFYQKGSKDTSVLEKNANEYPYSSLAAFLLLYHYKKTSNPGFENYAKKTALLFNNPHWLQFQLFDKAASKSDQNFISDEDNNEENLIATKDNIEIRAEPSSIENVMELPVPDFKQETNSNENLQEENIITTKDNIEIYSGPAFTENVIEESVPNFEQETTPDENFPEENVTTTRDNIEISSEPSFIDNVMGESVSVSEDVTLNIPVGEVTEEPGEINHEAITEPLEERAFEEKNEIHENLEEPALSNAFQQNEFIKNETSIDENETIAFEPLHTVDYFASQGIKITEELLTKDKLGSQMKSFTAWLKSMKKLHSGKLEEQSLATEKLIQASANESNFNTEILTEAMAEVLIKQDKKDKAIEMFNKLSLINPSKSAYFAARIESIKSN